MPELQYEDGVLVPQDDLFKEEGAEQQEQIIDDDMAAEIERMRRECEQMEQDMLSQRRQDKLKFEQDFNEVSLIGYLERKRTMAERCKLRTEVERTVKDWTEIQRNAGLKTDT